MHSQLTPDEVHAILKSLEDLYVNEHKGYGDLTITLERESDTGNGRLETVRGIVMELDPDTVKLIVGVPPTRHEEIELSGVVRITIER